MTTLGRKERGEREEYQVKDHLIIPITGSKTRRKPSSLFLPMPSIPTLTLSYHKEYGTSILGNYKDHMGEGGRSPKPRT